MVSMRSDAMVAGKFLTTHIACRARTYACMQWRSMVCVLCTPQTWGTFCFKHTRASTHLAVEFHPRLVLDGREFGDFKVGECLW